MTDRELLELAAKAVNSGSWHPLTHDTPNGRWNPLEDDGDALRLAVKLKIHISGFYDKVTTDTDERSFCENYGSDEYAATRRAIVRAAASIGDQMK